MRTKVLFLVLSLALAAGTVFAQLNPPVADMSSVYCSGVVTTQPLAHDTYIISGEQSASQITFEQNDLVYINKGSAAGVKLGDEFLVMRATKETLEQPWFVWQTKLMRAMGTTYEDIGRVKVVHVDEKTATARVVLSCAYMQRGDLVQAFIERPAPPLKESAKLDRFAAPSGKTAMVVTTKGFGQVAGVPDIVYVNLGGAQGVKVGDYFRIFRYQGARADVAPQTPGYAYMIYGFGSTPVRYQWNDVPREILGEGVVLRVGPNAATVLITTNVREIYVGDYVEIEQ
jgi:hypothetical protein